MKKTFEVYPKGVRIANGLPRGIRNNNPLNIRFNVRNDWKGQLGSDRERGGMCVFSSPVWGFRAAFLLLQNYQVKHGCRTIRDIITKWAPPEDHNDTEAYIRRVCEMAKCEPQYVPVFDDYDALSGADACAIVKAMSVVENGKWWDECLSYKDILKAYQLVYGAELVDDYVYDYLGILP